MIYLFQNKQNISELQYQYKIMSGARQEIFPKFDFKEEQEKETDRKNESIEEIKEEKKENEEKKEEKKEVKESKKEEGDKKEEDNDNEEEEKKENEESKKTKTKEKEETKEKAEGKEKEESKEKEEKEIKEEKEEEEAKDESNEHFNNENNSTFIKNVQNAIIFDGSISPLWYSYLVNLFDPNNYFTLKDADFLDLSKEKFSLLILFSSSISSINSLNIFAIWS